MVSISASIQQTILSLVLSRLPIKLDKPAESPISFANGPTIHLSNISLDEEKLASQITQSQFHIRSAHFEELEIKVGRDGIYGKVRGLKAVVTPKLEKWCGNTSLVRGEHLEDVSENEALEEVMQSVVGLVDAVTSFTSTTIPAHPDMSVSTANTKNVDYSDNISEDDDSTILRSIIESSESIEDSEISDKKGSWINYITNYLLKKVKVDIDDVTIKVISDPVGLNILIKEIEVETENGERKCIVEKVSLFVNSGLDIHTKKGSNDLLSTNIVTTTGVDIEKNTNPEDFDSDSDFNEELMSSSIMAQSKEDFNQSLLGSLGNTVYMSAVDGSCDEPFIPQKTRNTDTNIKDRIELYGTLFLSVDSISFVMGLPTPTHHVKIEIGSIQLILNPLLDFLDLLLDILISISKQQQLHSLSSKVSSTAFKGKKESNFFLDHFNVSEIKIIVDSTYQIDELSKVCGFTLICTQLSIQQRGLDFYQGSLMEIQVHANEKTILSFDNKKGTHLDIKFEIQFTGLLHTFSIICSNLLTFDLDHSIFECMKNLFNEFDSLFVKIEEFNHLKLKRKQSIRKLQMNSKRGIIDALEHTPKTEFNLLLAGIFGTLEIDNSKTMIFQTAAIEYNSTLKNFELGLFKVRYGNKQSNTDLINIQEIKFNDFGEKMEKVHAYDNNTRSDRVFNTKKIFSIEKVDVNVTYEASKEIFCFLAKLKTLFNEEKSKKNVQFGHNDTRRSNKLTSSILLRKPILNAFCGIKELALSFKDIPPDFGDLKGKFTNIGVCLFLDGLISGFVEQLKIFRKSSENKVEQFINFANKWEQAPMIFFKYDKAIQLFLKNWELEYYGEWIKIFDQNSGIHRYKEQDETDVNIEEGKSIFSKIAVLNLFISISDFAIGLNPINLPSKGTLVITKSTTDLIIYNDNSLNSQTTIDKMLMFLIDDCKNIGDGSQKDRGSRASWMLPSILNGKGFSHVASLSTVLINVRFNTLKSSFFKDVDGREYLPLIDLKFNIAKAEINLCSDSLQCLLGLLKDLKQPIEFSHKDKYSSVAEQIVDTFNDLDSCFYDYDNSKIRKNNYSKSSDNESVSNGFTDDLKIMDDYYDKVDQNKNEMSKKGKLIPMAIFVNIIKGKIYLHDGYDWKETRKQIRAAVVRVSKMAKDLINTDPGPATRDSEHHENSMDKQPIQIVNETIYKSIYLSMPTDQDANHLVSKINADIGFLVDNSGESVGGDHIQGSSRPLTIDLGKNKTKPLMLKRSKEHKVAIEFEDLGIECLVTSTNEPHLNQKPLVYSEPSEIINKIDVRIKTFSIIDNVPSSSWNMFAGYLRDAGEFEIGKSMLHLNIQLVRPIANLAAIEMIMHVSVLPLRLHVDQDTLDFIMRFCEFKDLRFLPPVTEPEEMFLEKFSIDSIQLKLDYKPKNVDYAGIRSGHMGEFVNFFVLDESKITLNKIVLYGVPGFSRLNTLLNGYWSPDVKKNQLGDVLSGLSFLRSIVNIGSGFNKLITVPVQEYQKDGRIVKSLQKGAYSFTKTTGGEFLKLGAKLATGTQNLLQNTEELFGGLGSSSRKNRGFNDQVRDRISNSLLFDSDYEDYGDGVERVNYKYFKNAANFKIDEGPLNDFKNVEDSVEVNNGSEEELIERERVFSLYSNQPETFQDGLKTAYGSIQRNFESFKDTLVEAGNRASVSTTASGAALEIVKVAPVIVIRPMIATSEAISKTLMGGVNNINPKERFKAEEKYKKYVTDEENNSNNHNNNSNNDDDFNDKNNGENNNLGGYR